MLWQNNSNPQTDEGNQGCALGMSQRHDKRAPSTWQAYQALHRHYLILTLGLLQLNTIILLIEIETFRE